MVLQIKILIVLYTLIGLGIFSLKNLLSPSSREIINNRIIVAIVLMPTIATLAPNVYFLYAGLFLTAALLPRSPIEALGLFILCSFLLPTFSTFQTLPNGTYLMPIDNRIFITAGLFFHAIKANQRNNTSGRSITLLILSLSLIIFFIDLRSSTISSTSLIRSIIVTSINLILPYILLTMIMKSNDDVKKAATYLICVAFILIFVAGFELVKHWALYDAMSMRLGLNRMSTALNMRGGLLRSSGPFNDPTVFGVFLAIAGTIIYAMRGSFKSQNAHRVAISLLIFGIFATLARNGWVGLIVGFLAASVHRGQTGRFVSVIFISALMLFTLSIISPASSILSDLLGQSGHAASTATYRETLFQQGLALIRQHPLIGLPLDRVTAALTNDLRSGSLDVDFVNTYLYFAMTSGVLAAVIFLATMAVPQFMLWRRRGYNAPGFEHREVAASIFGGLAALTVMFFFTSFYDRLPIMTVILLAMARGILPSMTKSGAAKP